MTDVEELIGQLQSWQRAYPLSAFPEPDLERARKLLEAGGMTLDSVSASSIRHVVSQIVPPVLEALTVSPADLEAAACALVANDFGDIDMDRWMANDAFAEDYRRLARAAATALGLRLSEGVVG